MQRSLRRDRAAHVFHDEATMERVAQAVIAGGEFTGMIREYQRYGLLFSEPIGYRIASDGATMPSFYGEVKIDAENRYHVIPRTGRSEG